MSIGRVAKASDAIFLGATKEAELGRIGKLKSSLRPDGALWVIRPKGRPEISEMAVMRAGQAAGLVDVKVVSFSATAHGREVRHSSPGSALTSTSVTIQGTVGCDSSMRSLTNRAVDRVRAISIGTVLGSRSAPRIVSPAVRSVATMVQSTPVSDVSTINFLG